jgi:uncharacterized protein (DUF427 family)
MAIRFRDLMGSELGSLRYEPTTKRLRASLQGETVAETEDGRLVWEPRRVVPTYAVPESDLAVRLVPAHATDAASPPVLDPRVPFSSHTCEGASFDVVTAAGSRAAAAFRPADRDLAGYLVLDFAAFDWREEDEPIVSHPRDPFHRIDILASGRRVRIELAGRLLAESSRPTLLFETLLPVRFYLPREDLAVELAPSDTATFCAYKGRAGYLSVPGGPADVAWTYPEPLHEAEPVRDLIAFFNERVDVIVDGRRQDRPITPWSR